MIKYLTRLAISFVWGFILFCSPPLHAQTYPSRPITIVVPLAPGTSSDILARHLAASIQKKFKVSVIVEDKLGAGTLIASKFVADAPPDGYTLFFNGSSSALAPETNPTTRGKKNYVRDMTYVSPIAIGPNMFVVPGSLPVNTIAEFIAYVKANPGKVSYGTPGIGSSPHLQIELFKKLTKTEMTPVPYKNSNDTFTDLIAGRIQLTVATYGSIRPYVDSGKIKPLAVTLPDRVPGLDYPTMAEAGVPGLSVVPWVGISAPKGTPAPVVATLNRYFQEVMAEPDSKKLLRRLGLEPMSGDAKQFQDFVEHDIDKWVGIIKELGIKIG